MKRITAILAAVILVTGFSNFTFADEKPAPPAKGEKHGMGKHHGHHRHHKKHHRHHGRHQRPPFAKEMGLSDEQKAKLKELRQGIRKEDAKPVDRRADFRKGLENILTLEQKAKFEQMRAERQKNKQAPADANKAAPDTKPKQNFGPRK